MRKWTVLSFENHYHVLLDADEGDTDPRDKGAMAPNVNPFGESCLSKDVLVPTVAPADLKSVWAMQNDFQARHPGQQGAISTDLYTRACSPQADVGAVCSRVSMLGRVQHEAEAGHFRFPWIHDGEPEEVVFKIVATIPMVELQPGVVQEGFPIDVEELIRQIENESRV